MCFKNLPVEFDADGRARLKEGIRDPYSVTTTRPAVAKTDAEREEEIHRLLAANGHVKDINMDPVTRVAGALAVHVTADLEGRRYLDARSQATLFRGYEVILMGRDPRDAIFVSSRACGVCGGVHSHCSAYAIEMAMGLAPPPLGTVVRNMQEAAEMGYDNPLHLYLLAGPGYWDDPHAYDARYETCNQWGERRWSSPGVIIDGELVTTRLTDLNIGWEEFVEHSYYEDWAGDRYQSDPLGNPVSPYHPWNKRTLPKPTGKSWKEKYTWACTPRWARKVVEA